MPHAPSRVLVVDDDTDVRTAIAEALASVGHRVTEAVDGLEGLQVARQEPPDLILLDLMMPRMNGWQFRAAQQADPLLSRIPVVVVSGNLPEQVHAVGAVAHLHKPFSLSELLDAVELHAVAAA
jgi:CheY-like chemotaxis protein